MIARRIPPEVWTDWDVSLAISLELDRLGKIRQSGRARVVSRDESGAHIDDLLFFEIEACEVTFELPACEVDFILSECRKLHGRTVFNDAEATWTAKLMSWSQHGERAFATFNVEPR